MVFDDKMTLFNSLNGSILYRVCNNMTLQSSFKKRGSISRDSDPKKNNTNLGVLCLNYFASTFWNFLPSFFGSIQNYQNIYWENVNNNGNTKRLQVTKHLKKRSNSQKYTTNEYDFFFWIRQDSVMIIEAIVVTTSFHR